MYTLLREKEYAVDRDVWLRNEETGTIDVCFDFSLAFDETGFAFMEIGKQYECKIYLFGRAEKGPINGAEQYEVLSWSKQIGLDTFVKVRHGGDIYYVDPDEVKEFQGNSYIWFAPSRKDLIQVNDKIHWSCLLKL